MPREIPCSKHYLVMISGTEVNNNFGKTKNTRNIHGVQSKKKSVEFKFSNNFFHPEKEMSETINLNLPVKRRSLDIFL